ncbi:hypothetical protein ABRZ04_04255 [Castellaniella ginsengisoli]|uniref:Uncharacterized protein n=1 Tax=Castellaniella ginsengisoli TaxID=546114 RepID=A0AB39D274_9BURK
MIDTQKLRDLLENATPGPWDFGADSCPDNETAMEICRQNIDAHTKPSSGYFFVVYVEDGRRTAMVGHGPDGAANAELIAEAVNALPGLLDLIETQSGQLAEYARIAEETRTAADSRIDAQAAENTALREALGECREVLQIIAQPGWLSDALQSGGVARLSREVSAIKRQARAALQGEPKC